MVNLDLWRDDRNMPRSLLEEMWGTFDDLNRSGIGRYRTPTNSPMVAACDISETKDSFVLAFDVPGLKREDINVEVTGRQLTISGERKREEESNKGNTHRIERTFGKFQRSFDLPDGTDTESIEASYENGVLRLAVPKAEAGKTKKIHIGDEGKGFLKRLTTKNEAKTVNA